MELRWRPVLAGLPRTGDVPAGPARRERSGKADPGLARDLGRGAECLPLIVYLYLAVAVAVQRQRDASSDLDARLIPITVPDPLRLLRHIVIGSPRMCACVRASGLWSPDPYIWPASWAAAAAWRRDGSGLRIVAAAA